MNYDILPPDGNWWNDVDKCIEMTLDDTLTLTLLGPKTKELVMKDPRVKRKLLEDKLKEMI